MDQCCNTDNPTTPGDPTAPFDNMIENCHQYALDAKAQGRPIIGIMCEYTPRELIIAAAGVPVCLCGGSADMIGPAEEHLPANLCPLIKSTYGYHLQKANPFLEMTDLLVAETTCDGKKKMYELLAQTRPMYVLELPQKPDDPDAMAHWVTEMRKLKAHLEHRFNVEITDEKIRDAIKLMNRERHLRRSLAELMKSDNPPLTGRQLLRLKSNISAIAADFDKYTKVLHTLQSHTPPASQKDRVRVLLTGVPVVHGAERVIDIIESNGGLIVAADNCTGLKPILQDVDENHPDPIVALAEKYFNIPCSVMTHNNRRLETIKQLATDYRPQCIIDLIWQACLTYDVEAWLVKQLAEDHLNLPYMKIVTDYSPSDSARISLRIEALFETVKQTTTGRGGQ